MFAHLEFYEQTACRIAAEAAALLQKCMDSAETHELLALTGSAWVLRKKRAR